jgi:hypothetical protein
VTRIFVVPTSFAVNVAPLPSGAATRSPSLTPLVLLIKDQLSAATLATNLPAASRPMANTASEEPDASVRAVTRLPVPSAAVSMRTTAMLGVVVGVGEGMGDGVVVAVGLGVDVGVQSWYWEGHKNSIPAASQSCMLVSAACRPHVVTLQYAIFISES